LRQLRELKICNMSINCGAGLWKRAASFFNQIKEVSCFNCE
jgi:hypothetical protein